MSAGVVPSTLETMMLFNLNTLLLDAALLKIDVALVVVREVSEFSPMMEVAERILGFAMTLPYRPNTRAEMMPGLDHIGVEEEPREVSV